MGASVSAIGSFRLNLLLVEEDTVVVDTTTTGGFFDACTTDDIDDGRINGMAIWADDEAMDRLRFRCGTCAIIVDCFAVAKVVVVDVGVLVLDAAIEVPLSVA